MNKTHLFWCNQIYIIIFAIQKPIKLVIMINNKWVKTFISPEGQVNVTATPSSDKPGMFEVEARVMVDGKMHSKLLYAGDNEGRAEKALDNFGRIESVKFLESVDGGGSSAEVEEVEDTEEDKTPEGAGPSGSSGPDDSGLAGATDAEYDEMTKEEMESAIGSLTEDQLEGWTSCMKKKIVGHYGPEVEACTDGITHGNWEKILECIVTVLGITNPEVWIPEQIVLFTGWSLECIFDVTPQTDSPDEAAE